MTRIALIHATSAAINPVIAAFSTDWPEPDLVNILDDSLSRDRTLEPGIGPAMHKRFEVLGEYALSLDADAILFTCSAFGPAIERVAAKLGIPVLKPNEAMFAEAMAKGRRIGMLATFEPTITSLEAEFAAEARKAYAPASLHSVLVSGAAAALQAGDRDRHDALIAEAAETLVDCDAVMLAQFSMAPAASLVRERLSVPVLTSPSSAVVALKRRIASRQKIT